MPRSIVVEAREDLPKVALLYASVEGFLRLPLIGSRSMSSTARRMALILARHGVTASGSTGGPSGPGG